MRDGRFALASAAATPGELLRRLHGLWGVGILADEDASLLELVTLLLDDGEPWVRAHAARILGDARHGATGAKLVRALNDESAVVQREAALALGKLQEPAAVEPLFELLAQVQDSDPALRCAAIIGLSGCASSEQLTAAIARDSVHARLGAVVALRRARHPAVALFLEDPEPLVVVEAARAIHDVPIPVAMTNLAGKLRHAVLEDNALTRRVLNANFRLGGSDRAQDLADFALREDARPEHRREALELLALWQEPPGPRPRAGRLAADPRPASPSTFCPTSATSSSARASKSPPPMSSTRSSPSLPGTAQVASTRTCCAGHAIPRGRSQSAPKP